MRTSWPSTKPASRRPWRKASMRGGAGGDTPGHKRPMVGMLPTCCPHDTRGHDTARMPSSLTASLRRMNPPPNREGSRRSAAVTIRSGMLLGWLAFEVGGIGKGVGAAVHPYHSGRFRSLRAPGVRRQRWNDNGIVGTNDTAFFAKLHPDPAFKHYDGLFYPVHVERHRRPRLRPVNEQANPACAEVLMREKSSVNTGPHQDFRKRAPFNERHGIP